MSEKQVDEVIENPLGAVKSEQPKVSFLDVLNTLLRILGNVSLEEAKTWLEVQSNAQKLREEGHETEDK